MHSFEVKIPIPESVYKELLGIPRMEQVSNRVYRSNYYSKKGIKQIELRQYVYYREYSEQGKRFKQVFITYYLIFRCNANQLVGGDPLFVIDTKKYMKQDLLSALQKRISEIKEFQNIKWFHINVNYMTTDRVDASKDIFVDTPQSICVSL